MDSHLCYTHEQDIPEIHSFPQQNLRKKLSLEHQIVHFQTVQQRKLYHRRNYRKFKPYQHKRIQLHVST